MLDLPAELGLLRIGHHTGLQDFQDRQTVRITLVERSEDCGLWSVGNLLQQLVVRYNHAGAASEMLLVRNDRVNGRPPVADSRAARKHVYVRSGCKCVCCLSYIP